MFCNIVLISNHTLEIVVHVFEGTTVLPQYYQGTPYYYEYLKMNWQKSGTATMKSWFEVGNYYICFTLHRIHRTMGII